MSKDTAGVAKRPETGWVFGHYRVRCLRCQEEYELEDPESLRPFQVRILSRKGVGLMVSRWGKRAPDDGWNHALRPAIDPYGASMEGLLAFFKTHRTHHLEASVRAVGR